MTTKGYIEYWVSFTLYPESEGMRWTRAPSDGDRTESLTGDICRICV